MKTHWTIRTAIGIGILATCSTLATAQLQSVDEAISLSKETGRPIFALAGSKT